MGIYGEPGSRKDYPVYSICKDELYVKNLNKWWDGYSNDTFILTSNIELLHSDLIFYAHKLLCVFHCDTYTHFNTPNIYFKFNSEKKKTHTISQ